MVGDIDGNKMADIVCFNKIIGKIEVFFNPISNTGKMQIWMFSKSTDCYNFQKNPSEFLPDQNYLQNKIGPLNLPRVIILDADVGN